MKKTFFVLIIAVGLKCVTLKATTKEPVEKRLAILKLQIAEKIKEKQHSVIPPEDDQDVLEANMKELARSSDVRVTPISRHRKKKRFSTAPTLPIKGTTEERVLRDANSSSISSSAENSTEDLGAIELRMQQIKAKAKKWAKHLKKYGTPLEIFYRRDSKNALDEKEIRRRHMMNCVDLLRPVLNGMKKNFTQSKVLFGDQVVNRLTQLLSYGGTGQSADEIKSILLQINNMQIRFFQWDVYPIKKFFNFIMPGQKHSFKSMKHGVKRMLFSLWKMDLSDTNRLIQESRMFRPPCVNTAQGSTRSSKGTRYTVPAVPKSTCAPKDKKCLEYAQVEDDTWRRLNKK